MDHERAERAGMATAVGVAVAVGDRRANQSTCMNGPAQCAGPLYWEGSSVVRGRPRADERLRSTHHWGLKTPRARLGLVSWSEDGGRQRRALRTDGDSIDLE
jgi:hypothetical protein